jgi:putative membrane protein
MTPRDDLPRSAKDRGTELAEERTSLAVKRSFFAAERTLMAWMRTALSMISFGFTMVKFFEYLDKTRGPTVGLMGRTWSPEAVGLSLISIGVLSLIAAIQQHWKELQDLRQEGLARKWSLAFLVATLVAVLGVFALATILMGQ